MVRFSLIACLRMSLPRQSRTTNSVGIVVLSPREISKTPLEGFGAMKWKADKFVSSVPVLGPQVSAISCAPVTHPVELHPESPAVRVPVAPAALIVSSAISRFSFPQG